MPEQNPNVNPAVDNPSQSAPAPTAGDPTPAPEGSPSFDVSAFESKLKKFGPDWSLDNWETKLSETRRTLGKQGRELAEIKTKYQEVEPFVNAMRGEHGFREHVGEAVRQFYAGQAGTPVESFQGQYQGFTPAPLAPFDPMVQRLNSVETELRTEKINRELEDLKAKGYPLDEDMADAVTSNVLNSRFGSARDHYMMLYGEQVAEYRAQQAAKAAAEAIQKNNASYSPAPSRSAAPAAAVPDVASMSEAEYQAYANRRWSEVLGKL
jgi:hypothetical protein